MASPPALTPSSRPASAEQALRELVLLPEARYEELLAIPAQYAMDALGGHSASLSRWERDRGLLRTLVNVGELSAAETRFPRAEVYEAATDTAIARVLVGEPKLLLIDEPTEGLAPKIVDEIFALITTLRAEGIAILLVEQHVHRALDVCSRSYVMARGQIVFEGDAAEAEARDTLLARLAV